MASNAPLDQVTRWGKIPAWWLLHPAVDADRLAVMAALCTYADEAGFCEPSQATLARRLSRSRPWVNRVIADLATAGLIRKQARSRQNGGTTSCRYQLAQTPEQARSFVQDGPPPVMGETGLCPNRDRPCHPADTSHAIPEQIQDTHTMPAQPRADTPAEWQNPEKPARRGSALREPPPTGCRRATSQNAPGISIRMRSSSTTRSASSHAAVPRATVTPISMQPGWNG